MTDISEIVSKANNTRDEVYNFGSLATPSVTLEVHKDPLDFLIYLEELKQFLPLNHYFEKHFIGTDPFSNAAIIRHVDFESKGRGGLDFKLERIYSSLTAYSGKGEFLSTKHIKRFYEVLRDIVDPDVSTVFRDSVLNWFFETYKQLLIDTRELVNIHRGESRTSGPQYDDYNDVHELMEAPIPPPFSSLSIPDLDLVILPDDTVVRGYEHTPPPFPYPPIVILTMQLRRLVRLRFLNFIQDAVSLYNSKIDQLNEQETTYMDSILGDGWTFTLPHIQIPTQVAGNDGFIFFDGYIREKYDGESEKKFLKHKAYLTRLSIFDSQREISQRFLNIHSDDRRITQEDIDELEYRVEDGDGRIFYFNHTGLLRVITDATHNNAIKLDYYGSLISRIVDAAGNTYQFHYRDDGTNKLEKIVSSYGKEIEYGVKESEHFNDIYLLESLEERDHKTTYEYDEVLIFESPLFVDGEVHVPIIKKETNPLGGVVNFFYYAPSIEDFSAGFSRTSIVEEDVTLSLKFAKTPWNIERIHRGSDFENLLVGHPRVEEDIVDSLPLKPLCRKTVSVYKDHIIEYEFRETYGEMKLFRRTVMDLKWHPSMGVFISQYIAHVGEVLKSEMFKYYPNLLLWIKSTVTGNPSPSNPSLFLKEEFVYPENPLIKYIYGLPEEIIYSQEPGDEELRRIRYFYLGSLPLITGVDGDTKHIRYQYFTPREQDPAGCRKPTIVIERTQNPPYYIRTLHWYDQFGNLIKTKNSMNRTTRYEYAPNNGQPETFLHKIIEEERNA